jgi:hypothetical protein
MKGCAAHARDEGWGMRDELRYNTAVAAALRA